MRPAFALLFLALPGCIDFGYEIREVDASEPPDAGGTDPGDGGGGAGDSGGGACEEGPTSPTTDGPQLRYSSLNVDNKNLRIQVGDTVTWTNGDTERHTVTAGAPGAQIPPARGGFDSGELAPGGRWAYRFCRARTVIYFCTTHPSQMNNYRVLVE